VDVDAAQLFATAYRLGADASGEAERAVATWVRAATPRAIVELAAVARTSFRNGVWTRYVPLTGPLAAELLPAAAPNATLEVAALLTTHRSGFVRELGLTYLAGASDPVVIPFLLLRTDDIVPALREIAERAIEARLQADYAHPFAACLGVVEALRKRTRGGGGRVTQLVYGFLARPELRDALAFACTAADPIARRMAFELRLKAEPTVHVLSCALADRDTRVRLWGARMAASRLTSVDDKRALVPILEASASPWTRLLALRTRNQIDALDAPIEAALLDPNARVRYAARTMLRARRPERTFGETRARAVAALSTSDPTAATIIGALGALADVGTPDDEALATRFADDPRPRVRAEAARTRAWLTR
jgi:hypothetical protein